MYSMKSRGQPAMRQREKKDDHCGISVTHSVGHMYPRYHSIMKKGQWVSFLSPSKLSRIKIESDGCGWWSLARCVYLHAKRSIA